MKRFKRALAFSSGVTFTVGATYLIFYVASNNFKNYNIEDLYGTEKFNILCQASPETCENNFKAAYAGFFGTIVLAFIALLATGESMAAAYECLLGNKQPQEQEQGTLLQDNSHTLAEELGELNISRITNHKDTVDLLNRGIEKVWEYEKNQSSDREQKGRIDTIRAHLKKIQDTGYAGDDSHLIKWRIFEDVDRKLGRSEARIIDWEPGVERHNNSDRSSEENLAPLSILASIDKSGNPLYENLAQMREQIEDQDHKGSTVSPSL